MLPGERELVGKMAGRPFTLLGINSDQDRSVLKKKFAKEKITWPNIYDESPGGPIARQWNVHAWPTIYVIDAEGVIRHRDLHGPEFERVVEEMVKAVENGKGAGAFGQ